MCYKYFVFVVIPWKRPNSSSVHSTRHLCPLEFGGSENEATTAGYHAAHFLIRILSNSGGEHAAQKSYYNICISPSRSNQYDFDLKV